MRANQFGKGGFRRRVSLTIEIVSYDVQSGYRANLGRKSKSLCREEVVQKLGLRTGGSDEW
jgi:hypothetical protein